jgi:hypothetical protein
MALLRQILGGEVDERLGCWRAESSTALNKRRGANESEAGRGMHHLQIRLMRELASTNLETTMPPLILYGVSRTDVRSAGEQSRHS